MIQTEADNAKNFLVSWLRSPFSAWFGTALRSKITPTKKLRSFRFDRGYASRLLRSLLARYRVIMTALWRLRCQSSFAAARSRAARVAPPRPQHARARLLISCLPIFLLFIFARSSSAPCGISRIAGWCARCASSRRAYYRSYCTSYEFMIALLIGNVDDAFRNPRIVTQIEDRRSLY